jgi:hypothetical protein
VSAFLTSAAASWWQWAAAVSLQVALLALLFGLCERLIAHRAPSAVRAVFPWAVWLRLCLPAQWDLPLVGEAPLGWIGSQAPLNGLRELVELPAAGLAGPAAAVGLLVALALGGTALARLHHERVRLQTGSTAATGRAARAAKGAARRLGLRRVPPVFLSPGAPGPLTHGVFRARVLLPRECAAWSEERLEHVLLHEFAHVTRRDGLAAAAWLAARVVFWFHPLIHWTAARAATLREIGADERASAAVREPLAYRRTLLQLARPLARGPSLGSSAFLPPQAAILSRLEALQHPRRLGSLAARSLAATTLAALGCCALPLAVAVKSPHLAFDELQGCLRKRYAVLAALAAVEHGSTPPDPSTNPPHNP